jgi:hypothetical protein
MDLEDLPRLLAILAVAFAIYLTYRYEFQLKSFWRTHTKCRKTGHKWFTVYSFTQQCKVCYKVSEISHEVTKR